MVDEDNQSDQDLADFLNRRRVDPSAVVEIGEAVKRNTKVKRPGGLLGLYLYFWAILSAIGVVTSLWLLVLNDFGESWDLWPTPIFGTCNLVCLLALIRWKKWGLYGLTASTLGLGLVDVFVLGRFEVFFGALVALAILFALLGTGRRSERGWDQLK